MRGRRAAAGLAAVACVVTALAVADAGHAASVSTVTLKQVSTLSVPNPAAQPAVQNIAHVDTASASHGSTIVAAFEVGRSLAGFGGAAIGYATSTDKGHTWSSGLLKGVTARSPHANSKYPLAVDQTVAYDAKHAGGTWLIPSVTYVASGSALPYHEKAILVSSSTDGTSWRLPVTAVASNADKSWIACDNTSTSPFYGTCYIAYSQLDSGYDIAVIKSTDGGTAWSAPVHLPNGSGGNATGYNAVPVVQPDGNVVIIDTDLLNGRAGSKIFAFSSADGGSTWGTGPVTIDSGIQRHKVPGPVRARTKPTVAVDATGQINVVWSDCRFESGCSANDLVRATSSNGLTWSPATKLNIDPSSAAYDKFVPGFAIRRGTSGATAQLALTYYTFGSGDPDFLAAQYTTSTDGGTTWSPPYTINTFTMATTSFARGGFKNARMFGDYNTVSFVHGSPVAVLPLAEPPSGATYHQTEWAFSVRSGANPTPRAPKTIITKHPKKKVFLKKHHRRKKVTFRFSSSQPGSTFTCKRGHRAWKRCRSGVTWRFKAGKHTFKVRARHLGLTDATPARFTFRVKKRKHHPYR